MSATSEIIAGPHRVSRKATAIRVAGGVLGALSLLLLPLFIKNSLHLNLLILILMAAQMGVSWNIIGGYAGQISLGHAAFFGVGAYTSTILFVNFSVNPWIGMLIGGTAAAMVSLPVGFSCFRLKG